MRSSRLLSVLLVLAWGCGRSSATPPIPPTPAPISVGSGAYGGVARRPAPATVTLSPPLALDPSEAITPRELASIPDPVPGERLINAGQAATDKKVATGEAAAAVEKATAAESEIATAGPTTVGAGARADLPRSAARGDERRGTWRVQVFASPDLEQADRIAKEVSLRFGVPSVIEFEDSLYKVRLGGFATEALAQSLRERAVAEGFPGAFRMWSAESK